MSHKDYVKIAGALAEAREEMRGVSFSVAQLMAVDWAIEAVEVRLSRILADDNPRFDRARFHAAAIGEPTTGRDRVR